MNRTIKIICIVALIPLSYYTGHTIYEFFFSTTKPTIYITGIESHGHYKGDIVCAITLKDLFKLSQLKIAIDGKPAELIKMHGRNYTYEYKLATADLSDGFHELEIEAINGTYHRISHAQTIKFVVDNKPLYASLLHDSDIKVLQGRTLHVKFQVNKPIKNAIVNVFNQQYACYPELDNSLLYEAFIPVSCEEKVDQHGLLISLDDFAGNNMHLQKPFQVVSCQFKRQQLNINQEHVKKEKESGANDAELEKELQRLAMLSPAQKLWYGSFYIPCEMQGISTEFGTIRVTQEKGKYMHKAVDLIATPKSVIWAPQDGKVIIKNRYAMSGNTLVLDHGCGIFSLFYHLDEFALGVEVGDILKKGNPVGTLGKTGYAAGYHLHWEMRIHNVAIDPMQWASQQF